ncbi:MAG TPA: hypothetical protein VGN34_00995 [Ktedonobacteraceae bacterium]|jgi:hypothetical protein
MNLLTLFGAGAVSIMLLSYALEARSRLWVLVFAFACAASSVYGWLSGTWPFGVVEGIWALKASGHWLLFDAGGVYAHRFQQLLHGTLRKCPWHPNHDAPVPHRSLDPPITGWFRL